MPSLAVAWTHETCLRREAVEALRELDRSSCFLSEAEKLICRRLATEKRRLDWLSGRLAAKKALAPRLNADARDIEILNEPSGRPYCTHPEAPAISISHTQAGGLCAVSAGSEPIGADWEAVAPRDPRMLEFYTRPEERGPQVLSDARLQTRLWSAKEAVLKLLGLGLGCDPRDVGVLPCLKLHDRALARWRELGRPALSLWEKDLADSVVAVAHLDPGAGGSDGKN